MKQIVLIGIDGLIKDLFNEECLKDSTLVKFFNNGSILFVNSNVPTDSAENWGSILTGVVPKKHQLKYENLNKPYNNNNYPSLFSIILKNNVEFKVAAYVSWEPIITGMIENTLNVDKYAPKLNEDFLSKVFIYICHYWLKNPIYDYYLVKKVLKYIEENKNTNFLFVHLVDLDEIGHIFGFNSKKYIEKLIEIDGHVKLILDKIYKCWSDPLIVITTDHGGHGKSHGGDSDVERNVFIGSNKNINNNYKSNMSCSQIILEYLNIDIPPYFDNEPQNK